MEDIKQKVIKHYKGSWKYENDDKIIEVKISKEHYSVLITEAGNITCDFESDASFHWLGDYLLDWGYKNRFHIKYADENNLIFGRHKSTLAGDIEWEYELERV